MFDLFLGIHFLHNAGILHRYVFVRCRKLHFINQFLFKSDLKPANILITKDGIVKLADFGLSKILTSPTGKHRFSLKYEKSKYSNRESCTKIART